MTVGAHQRWKKWSAEYTRIGYEHCGAPRLPDRKREVLVWAGRPRLSGGSASWPARPLLAACHCFNGRSRGRVGQNPRWFFCRERERKRVERPFFQLSRFDYLETGDVDTASISTHTHARILEGECSTYRCVGTTFPPHYWTLKVPSPSFIKLYIFIIIIIGKLFIVTIVWTNQSIRIEMPLSNTISIFTRIFTCRQREEEEQKPIGDGYKRSNALQPLFFWPSNNGFGFGSPVERIFTTR